VIDRLSIVALRLYHMEEQAAAATPVDDHVAKAKARLEILHSSTATYPRRCRNCSTTCSPVENG